MVPYFGVFCPERVGVGWSSFASAVLIGAKIGLVAFAGSGRLMSSMLPSPSSTLSEACSFRLESPCCFAAILPACFLILISDAGVAGSSDMDVVGAELEAGCFATSEGERPAVLDLGVAGGGINISDRDSGEIDSASELS